jgi:hypothetical protein
MFLSAFWIARLKIFDKAKKLVHNRGLRLKKYEGSAQMEAM